jgi:prepilin-type N-terminal cleavage/methylation domain-containing protein
MLSCCRKTDYGFTLLEMILVLIIGGVLTAIAIPAFMNWAPKYRANGAARQVFSEMMAARAKAISEGNNYVISFNVGNNTYTIHDNDDNDNPPVQDAGESVRTVDIPVAYPGIEFGYIDANSPSGNSISSAVTFSGSPPKVTFQPSGLITNLGGTVYLKPADGTRRDRQRCITVIRTGRVRLYKHTGSGWE